MTTNADPVKEVIQAAARMLMDAALGALQRDPHQWSERPCETCRSISGLIGRSFGCYLYAEQRAEQRARSGKESVR